MSRPQSSSRSGTKRLMQELARFEQVQQARERERSRYYNHGKTTELGSGGVGLGGLQGDTDGDDVDRELDPIERMGVVGDDLTHWEVVITGPDETAYEGGRWKLDIRVPESYPNEPPTVTFVTPICHPNVKLKTGEICLDLLKSAWSPIYTLDRTVLAIHQLLAAPAPDSPLNVDIAILMNKGDYAASDGLIRYYTRLHRYQGV